MKQTSASEPETSRVLRPREAARHTYDKISRWYDVLEGVWETKSKDAALSKLAVKEGETVLEVGFGTGHGIVQMARAVGQSGKVYGIDISSGMHEVTRQRLEKSRLSSRASLLEGDAVCLPFQENFFDAVFMSFVLELFDTPDIPAVLSECKRVLKPGGRICVLSLSNEGGRSVMRELYEWGHRRFPNLFDCRPIYVGRALEEAGFHIETASTTSIVKLPVETILARKGNR
jgi:ubiquinone/menaquinone biosynthesis C-methylase UbiE